MENTNTQNLISNEEGKFALNNEQTFEEWSAEQSIDEATSYQDFDELNGQYDEPTFYDIVEQNGTLMYYQD